MAYSCSSYYCWMLLLSFGGSQENYVVGSDLDYTQNNAHCLEGRLDWSNWNNLHCLNMGLVLLIVVDNVNNFDFVVAASVASAVADTRSNSNCFLVVEEVVPVVGNNLRNSLSQRMSKTKDYFIRILETYFFCFNRVV